MSLMRLSSHRGRHRHSYGRRCIYYRYNAPFVVRRRIVILTAIQLEARTVAGVWGLPTPKPGQPVRTDGVVPSIEIHLVGIGATRLPEKVTSPLVTALIMAGVAGALDPTLRVGDVIIDDCPAAWLPPIPFRAGKIYSADEIVGAPADKQRLFAQSGALAVDMEAAIARELAARSNIPFISLRTISDAAHELLDPAVLAMVDDFGRPRPMSVAGTLLRRPSLIPQLKQLAANSRIAAKQLATALASIVERIVATELAPVGYEEKRA